MQIRIKGYTFQLTAPYSAGHSLTSGEAKALNDLRAENIQNNFRTNVNSQVAELGAGCLLTQAVIDALQAKLAAYDQSYRFNEKSGRSRIGDIEAEARSIALERVQIEAARGDVVLDEGQLAGLVEDYSMLSAVIEEARARVAARRSALAGGMESL